MAQKFIGQQTTVFDRAKANGGFMTGPNHPLDAQLDDPDKDTEDQENEKSNAQAAGAPNYREMEDASRSCKTCQHFEAEEGECELYHFNAKPFMVCDSWLAAGPEQGADSGAASSVADLGDNGPY